MLKPYIQNSSPSSSELNSASISLSRVAAFEFDCGSFSWSSDIGAGKALSAAVEGANVGETRFFLAADAAAFSTADGAALAPTFLLFVRVRRGEPIDEREDPDEERLSASSLFALSRSDEVSRLLLFVFPFRPRRVFFVFLAAALLFSSLFDDLDPADPEKGRLSWLDADVSLSRLSSNRSPRCF